jgi:ABC-type cobalamin/Fe3+-siderophores transport system ATPase subunit
MPESKSANVVRAIAVVGPTGAGKTALMQALASAASGGPGTVPAAAGQSTKHNLPPSISWATITPETPGAVDFLADADFATGRSCDRRRRSRSDKAVLVQPFLKRSKT